MGANPFQRNIKANVCLLICFANVQVPNAVMLYIKLLGCYYYYREKSFVYKICIILMVLFLDFLFLINFSYVGKFCSL